MPASTRTSIPCSTRSSDHFQTIGRVDGWGNRCEERVEKGIDVLVEAGIWEASRRPSGESAVRHHKSGRGESAGGKEGWDRLPDFARPAFASENARGPRGQRGGGQALVAAGGRGGEPQSPGPVCYALGGNGWVVGG